MLTCTGTNSSSHQCLLNSFSLSDDKPVGPDWEQILILEEIILHSMLSVVSILLLCIIYKVFGSGDVSIVEYSGGIRPHPIS
jgi:hypothetical protein